MKVENNKVVALRYSIKTQQGKAIVDIMNDPPFRYVCGSGGILPVLEQNIYGLEQGGQKSFVLYKAEQPGVPEDLYIDVIIDEISDAIPEKAAIATDSNCSGSDCCC